MTGFPDHKEIAALRNFTAENISDDALHLIERFSKKIRRDILTMTMKANSGHIGGSMSSADIYLLLWLCANCSPEKINDDTRDRIVISHGHTSPALYAVLGNLGFFDLNEAVNGFRSAKTIYEGHPSYSIPGVEWGSGSLGQGLSVGCGFAMASRLKKYTNRVFVVMGDGEQQKGQITEACEFASKHKLNNLTAIVDVNGLQASGKTSDVMPSNLAKKYEAVGWEVIGVNGHDFKELYKALQQAGAINKPVAILANTIMGKGFSEIEGNYEYHGKLLSKNQHEQALQELGDDVFLPSLKNIGKQIDPIEGSIVAGNNSFYEAGKQVECRTAAGEAIYQIIKSNKTQPIAVLDCDLAESVKTINILKEFPGHFIQCGIQEHNAATVCGALSKAGVLSFFLDFAVFGIDETYGQHRMNDTNHTSVKIIATHCGLDVGEDGKTHQCLDYISLINNLPGYKVIIPADANQTLHVVNYIAATPGNFIVAIGRSKVPVISDIDDNIFFGKEYSFEYGQPDWIREGSDATIITTGTLVNSAVQAADELIKENIRVGVLNISSPKDIDSSSIQKSCSTGIVITYEDHWVKSGIGTLVAAIIAENNWSCDFERMGVNQYGKSAPASQQYTFQNLDLNTLINKIKIKLKERGARFSPFEKGGRDATHGEIPRGGFSDFKP